MAEKNHNRYQELRRTGKRIVLPDQFMDALAYAQTELTDTLITQIFGSASTRKRWRENRTSTTGNMAAICMKLRCSPRCLGFDGDDLNKIRNLIDFAGDNHSSSNGQVCAVQKWPSNWACAQLAGELASTATPERMPADSDSASLSDAGADSPAPLEVLSIDVQHFEHVRETEVYSNGILGRQWFAPRLNDQVIIEARLSRPAYAFLVAFRPDGVVELCFPDDETSAPAPTDRPCYPSQRDFRPYVLSDGVGLWVFAVLASAEPLPPWDHFLTGRRPAWSGHPDARGGIWWCDGELIKPLDRLRVGAVSRGKGDKPLKLPADIVRAADSLKSGCGQIAAAIGFGVSE